MNQVYNATSARNLLVKSLNAAGYTYYPGLHRLMRKQENHGMADVIVVEFESDSISIYHSHSNAAVNTSSDILFDYDQVEAVMGYLATIDAPKSARVQTRHHHVLVA